MPKVASEFHRSLGSIYTPVEYAQFLSTWAIRTQEDSVLDLGVGGGAFVFAAYNRLRDLGSPQCLAEQQIYGTEIHGPSFEAFLEEASRRDLEFPNVHNEDFFNWELPQVDAIVGNPPYVRRSEMVDFEAVRESVLNLNIIAEKDLPRLTDLYGYFLLRALCALRPGGRLAVITADPWLNTRYGAVLRRYLHQNLRIDQLISFDRKVFDAEVKPVLLLATKKDDVTEAKYPVSFVRVMNGLPVEKLHQPLQQLQSLEKDVRVVSVSNEQLDGGEAWAPFFKTTDVCARVEEHELTVPFSQIATTRIGLQTLAKEFFVLSAAQVQLEKIEPEHLEPLAHSSRDFTRPVIDDSTPITNFLFHCSKSKGELANTNTLAYIMRNEEREVAVRGKGTAVVGYQNKKRIQGARRLHWYDLKTDLIRRGRATILIPRLLYKEYVVFWNQALLVPGELFIEFLPKDDSIETEVYLAILTSSATEVMLRTRSQVYGGGTYNLNPGHVKYAPILDPSKVSVQHRSELKEAYLTYLASEVKDRAKIDKVVAGILGLSNLEQEKLIHVLDDLVNIATSAKRI